jgi:opacity protein-like surface antigen
MFKSVLRALPLHALWGCALWLHAATACAQPSRGVDEPRTWLTLYGVAAQWQMQTRGDTYDYFGTGGAIAGTLISTEADLGLPKRQAVGGITFGRRIGQHWRIEVEHNEASREGSATLGRELRVDGNVFQPGTAVQSKVGLSTLSVLGGWSTTLCQATEAGVLVGGHWVRVSRRLWQQGTAPELGSDSTQTTLEPLWGLFVQHAWTPGWRMDGRLTASTSGNYQATAGVQWLLNRHLSLGAGYRLTRHHLDVESFVLIGLPSRLYVDARVHGPLFSATLAF